MREGGGPSRVTGFSLLTMRLMCNLDGSSEIFIYGPGGVLVN